MQAGNMGVGGGGGDGVGLLPYCRETDLGRFLQCAYLYIGLWQVLTHLTLLMLLVKAHLGGVLLFLGS